ncbi:histidine phosphatase family protein [Nocardioides dongxiaopingii]|uniref:histidine phosphatase family protein n=1 Tax=Nocardioides sp. S-1144 TaxID=2582905 RepID=UPI001651EF88|nr:histidine phosphatase family protein [Nocardioides sp. S-1144]
MATELYLIRHGEAVSNVEPVIAGVRSDRGLTERGRRQCALLEGRLRSEPLRADVLYVSTLRRAQETGEYVARALRLPARASDDLHELRPGAADGLTVEEWTARAGHEVPPRNPFQPFSTGGESWATFLLRAETALLGLVGAHEGRTVVAVCHGGILEASFNLAFGRGPTARDVLFDPLNTSITQWRHRRVPGGGSSWTLVRFNDAGHLAGRVAEESPGRAVPTGVDDHGTAPDE